MTWNYRIVKSTTEYGGRTHVKYAVHEVYYNDDGSIHAMTEDPVVLDWAEHEQFAEGALENLKDSVRKIAHSISKHPVLEEPIKFSRDKCKE